MRRKLRQPERGERGQLDHLDVDYDPRAAVGGNGVISDIDGVILVFLRTIDEQSPAFTRAAAVCRFPLHNH